jgi:alpha-beta hydrolase superfamily lysophospholipase
MGEVASFSRLVSDLGESLERVREETPGEIQFLFGHSMGGLVLGHYVATRGVSACGVVFSSPVAKVGEDVKPLLQKMSGIVAAVLPGMPVHSVDPEGISRDAEEVRAYKEDPLVYHGSINARTGHQLLTATKSLQQMFGKITKPILVTHGTSDRVVDCAAGRALHAGAGSHDKTLKLYEGAYHEVFNDLDRERFFADVIGWMNERWSTAATRVI